MSNLLARSAAAGSQRPLHCAPPWALPARCEAAGGTREDSSAIYDAFHKELKKAKELMVVAKAARRALDKDKQKKKDNVAPAAPAETKGGGRVVQVRGGRGGCAVNKWWLFRGWGHMTGTRETSLGVGGGG